MGLDQTYKNSFVGGTLFGILPNLNASDILVTIVMASIGALASFAVTVLLKYLVKRLKR